MAFLDLRKFGSSVLDQTEDRFKLVQAAIFAVRHDDNPQIKLGDKNITGVAYPPRGAQRIYHADVGGGKTVWVFTWADKIYIRSIQERNKNDPPYK